MKKLTTIILSGLFVMSPAFAFAQTPTSTNAQIQAMLTQIQALQNQIQTLKTAQAKVASSSTDVLETLSLLRNLREGMSGDDVKALQAILSSDPSIYQGDITGFFGKKTLESLKKFQKKHGFETVGFAGPKTIKKLNELIKELGLSKERKGNEDKICIKVPHGHLIASGWIKNNNGEIITIPECQKLPKGIEDKRDNTAPVIGNVGTNNLLGTTTNIVWTTNEPSNSKIWFGTNTPVATSQNPNLTNNSMVMSHSLNLSQLATSTTYYYVVTSSDKAGNTATSSQYLFTTTAGI